MIWLLRLGMVLAQVWNRKLHEGVKYTKLHTQQPYMSCILDTEEKEMKSFEMQLSHSLLFPLKPNYFSTRIQHMCGDTWKQGELINSGE